MVNQYKNTD